MVIPIVESPNRSETTIGWTPCCSNKVAWVCKFTRYRMGTVSDLYSVFLKEGLFFYDK